MMETLFENSYTSTKEQAKEFYRYFFFRRPILIIDYILLAAILIFGLLQFIMPDLFFESVYTELYIFVPVVAFAVMLFKYNQTVRVSHSRELALNHGRDMEHLDKVTAEGIEVQNIATGSVTHVSFDQITKKIETKNLYLLMMKPQLAIIFRKDGFTVGTLDGFRSFIKEKCPNLK